MTEKVRTSGDIFLPFPFSTALKPIKSVHGQCYVLLMSLTFKLGVEHKVKKLLNWSSTVGESGGRVFSHPRKLHIHFLLMGMWGNRDLLYSKDSELLLFHYLF